MDSISMPTHIGGERVVVLFPIIGTLDGYVEAQAVTTNGNENEPAARFRVHRVSCSGRIEHSGDALSSFPEAIRTARKAAGWG